MHREGISTPHAHHKGRKPLIECAKHDFQIMYFPFFIFLCIFPFYISLGLTRVFPSLLSILRCDEEFRPTKFFKSKSLFVKFIFIFLKD